MEFARNPQVIADSEVGIHREENRGPFIFEPTSTGEQNLHPQNVKTKFFIPFYPDLNQKPAWNQEPQCKKTHIFLSVFLFLPLNTHGNSVSSQGL